MESKKYQKYLVSEELNAQIVAEIAKAKSITKMRDCEIAEKLGKTKQNYSIMTIKGIQSIANIEAIANALGFEIEIKFVKKENR